MRLRICPVEDPAAAGPPLAELALAPCVFTGRSLKQDVTNDPDKM